MSTTVLPPVYFGPVNWWKTALTRQNVIFDINENYVKQTCRNRCSILSANGMLNLSVPVKKIDGNHTKLKNIRIENQQPWQRLHSRTIMSAYKASPYYDYVIDDIKDIWTKKFDFLLDLCVYSIEAVKKVSNVNLDVVFSEEYVKPANNIEDYRQGCFLEDNTTYVQVFSDRFDFVKNLSILDKIFNNGPEI